MHAMRRRTAVALDIRAERGAEASGGDRSLLRRAAQAAYAAACGAGARRSHLPLAEASVLLTDDAGMRALNKRTRGVDEPTDVLSFPFVGEWKAPGVPSGGLPKGPETGRVALGDIAISTERAQAQADLYGHGYARELAFLFVHGMLHLLGHGHGQPGEEAAMRAAQEGAMRELGLSMAAGATAAGATAAGATAAGATAAGATAESAGPARGAAAKRAGAPDSAEAAPGTAKAAPNATDGSKAHRAGFVALIGRANVGKSTLANAIAGMPLAIVSSKPQTTRRNLRMIVTMDSCQFVFVDTPGLHEPKNRLGKQMVRRAMSAAKDVDALALVVDARDEDLTAGDLAALRAAARQGASAVLVINKIDLVAKERLLPLIDRLRARHDFSAVIPVSATAAPGEASRIILLELEKLLPEGPSLYPADMVTDGTERELVADRIREKALLLLNDEVPHGVEVIIEQFTRDGDGGLAKIRATVICEKESHKKIIIGKGGASLKRIGSSARMDIERLLGAKVYLELWVKARSGWRDDAAALRQLGHADKA